MRGLVLPGLQIKSPLVGIIRIYISVVLGTVIPVAYTQYPFALMIHHFYTGDKLLGCVSSNWYKYVLAINCNNWHLKPAVPI